MKNRGYALIAAAVLVLGAATALPAQTVRGTVVDSATAQPLASVSVELSGADSQVVARERSDNSGNFRLRARGDGPYRVRVQRIGYHSLDSLVDTRGDTTLVLRLVAAPVPLGPVGVTAEEIHPYLRRSGFYERKQGGAGNFLDPPMVEKFALKAKIATDILDHIPGVNVMSPQRFSGLRVPQLRGCRTVSQRLGAAFGPVSSAPAPDTLAGDLSWFPRVYVDGVATPIDIFGSLLPSDILAAEVYMGPAQIPLQYGGTDAPCGVILIWTKR